MYFFKMKSRSHCKKLFCMGDTENSNSRFNFQFNRYQELTRLLKNNQLSDDVYLHPAQETSQHILLALPYINLFFKGKPVRITIVFQIIRLM